MHASRQGGVAGSTKRRGELVAQKTEEIQDIMQTLQSLQSRVQELSVQPQGQGVPAAPPTAGTGQMPVPGPTSAAGGNLAPDQLTLLRHGIEELSHLTKLKVALG